MPPVVTSYVEWADTQGPFPARIRCTAPSGCWISNRSVVWLQHTVHARSSGTFGCSRTVAVKERHVAVQLIENTPTAWKYSQDLLYHPHICLG